MRVSSFYIFLFTATAWAQLAVQGPQPLYNGQPVSAIDLVGNPHRDMEPLRPLVVQKAGQPYSQADVEASTRALEHTGLFPKVQVTVVPDPSGLRLNFLLEPAYYLGMINFPGAIKEFSYTRLLQVVNLLDEDPYDKARVDVAQQALQDFLRHNGYFQAVIQTDSQIDDAHQLVHLNFTVTMGNQARVARVSIQGPEGAENARLQIGRASCRERV